MSGHHTLLDTRAALRIGGADARDFLQAVITQDIDHCTPDTAQAAALLTPQGKLRFDFLIFAEADAYLIDCAAAARGALIDALTMYRLRSAVEIAEDPHTIHVMWNTEDAPPEFRRDPRHAALGFRALLPADAPRPDDAPDDWHAHRLALGVPEGAEELPEATLFPLECGFQHMHAIDFDKGCYIGQEVTSRVHRKGTLRKTLRPLTFTDTAPPIGTPVESEARVVGEIRAAHGNTALALIREDARAAPLTAAGQAAEAGAGLFPQ